MPRYSKGGGGDRWDDFCEAFVKYRREHNNDAHVPQSYVCSDGLKLGRWVNNVRCRGKQAYSDDKQQQLTQIGFVWQRRHKWTDMYQCLQDYQKQHGHCRVPKSFVATDDNNDNIRLGRWVLNQRTEYSRKQKGLSHHITDKQIDMLEKIGFVWHTQERYIVTEEQKKKRDQQSDDEEQKEEPTVGAKERKTRTGVDMPADDGLPRIPRKKQRRTAEGATGSAASVVGSSTVSSEQQSLKGLDIAHRASV